ncbi:MAG: Hpt domain-containing protein, partial [Gammaproteobacteria bacterium]
LREMGYTAPIVALTANAMNQEKQDCYDAGCNDVCTKPIDYPVFTRVLAKYLKQAANPVEQEGAPIVSELLKDEPDLLDLVQEFVRKLPDMIRKIEAAYNKKDVEELRQEVHTLKGTGGNFGYPELFELAKKIEFEIVANNFQAAGEMIESLALIAGRIAQGLETDEQAVSRDYPA